MNKANSLMDEEEKKKFSHSFGKVYEEWETNEHP